MTQRRTPIRSKAIRRAAKGEACTMNLPNLCNYDPQTVVLAHLHDESFGRGQKADDTSGAFMCLACHTAYDLHRTGLEPQELWPFVMRAYQRTIRRLVELDVLPLKQDTPKPFSARPTPKRKPKADRKPVAPSRPLPSRPMRRKHTDNSRVESE